MNVNQKIVNIPITLPVDSPPISTPISPTATNLFLAEAGTSAHVVKPVVIDTNAVVPASSDINPTSEEKENAFDPEFVPNAKLIAVVTKSDKEDDTVLFESWANLCIYSSKEQWKECGTGLIKILESSVTGRVFLVMWQDPTCMYQEVTKELKLERMAGNADNAWCCFGHDFTADDGVVTGLKKFAIRFKLNETADIFKAEIEAGQKRMEALGLYSSKAVEGVSAVGDAPKATGISIENMWATKGGWNCNTCYSKNIEELTTCLSWQTNKDCHATASVAVKTPTGENTKLVSRVTVVCPTATTISSPPPHVTHVTHVDQPAELFVSLPVKDGVSDSIVQTGSSCEVENLENWLDSVL